MMCHNARNYFTYVDMKLNDSKNTFISILKYISLPNPCKVNTLIIMKCTDL